MKDIFWTDLLKSFFELKTKEIFGGLLSHRKLKIKLSISLR
jgi:hypothetical protein